MAVVEWDELSWEDKRGILLSYEIVYQSTLDSQCPVNDSYNETQSTKNESYTITDLDPGLQYCMAVAAKTSAGVGVFSHALIPRMHDLT